MDKKARTETVRQEATRRGLSISEVRRQRNAEDGPGEIFHIVEGLAYYDGYGERHLIRKMTPQELAMEPDARRMFICTKTKQRYTVNGIHIDMNGPLQKFNLIRRADHQS